MRPREQRWGCCLHSLRARGLAEVPGRLHCGCRFQPFSLHPVQAASTPAAVKSLSELPAYPADFVRRRLLTFAGIVLGYSCFYLTRNSLTYTAPVMVRPPAQPPSRPPRLQALAARCQLVGVAAPARRWPTPRCPLA